MHLVEAAAELAEAPQRRYKVLVALVATAERALVERLDTWLSKGDVIAWLKSRGHDGSGLRVGGGFLYEVTARDPYGAAGQARQLLDRMTARSSFLRKSRDGIRHTESIWVDGHDKPAKGLTWAWRIHPERGTARHPADCGAARRRRLGPHHPRRRYRRTRPRHPGRSGAADGHRGDESVPCGTAGTTAREACLNRNRGQWLQLVRRVPTPNPTDIRARALAAGTWRRASWPPEQATQTLILGGTS